VAFEDFWLETCTRDYSREIDSYGNASNGFNLQVRALQGFSFHRVGVSVNEFLTK